MTQLRRKTVRHEAKNTHWCIIVWFLILNVQVQKCWQVRFIQQNLSITITNGVIKWQLRRYIIVIGWNGR